MLDPEFIVQEITPYLRPQATVWIAFSGGLDSSVLLHLMVAAKLPNSVKAIHINHQLSPHADQWQHHCQTVCQQLNVLLVCEKVDVESNGSGLEAAAREKRYEAFDRHLKKHDVLLLAHHLDDQAETLMFRLMRGSGLNGLAGIKKSRPFGEAIVVRPLLGIDRTQLEEFAHSQGLHWVEDDSNTDVSYDRNYLRHEILPLLKSRWQNATRKMFETSRWLAEAAQLLDEYALEDLQRCDVRTERVGESIAINQLLAFSKSRQKNIIRVWVKERFALTPEASQLQQVDELIAAKEEASPLLVWNSCELRRFKNRLYLLPCLPEADLQSLQWCSGDPLVLPGGGLLECIGTDSMHDFTVSFRGGGERCKPRRRQRSQTLKKLLQEYELEPWLRPRAPLIYADGELLAVADLFVCEHPLASNKLQFRWRSA